MARRSSLAKRHRRAVLAGSARVSRTIDRVKASSSRSISAPFSLCFSMLILLCSDKDSMYNSP